MHYIVGLGNPGEKYEHTRHNAGFVMLDHLRAASGLPAPVPSAKYVGRVSEGVVGEHEVTLLYPETFMNKSGRAVVKLVPKGAASQLIVIYDDLDLPIGEVKVSWGRGDGGHNGVKSIINALGTRDFARVRVGIAPQTLSLLGISLRPRPKGGAPVSRYVLGRFTKRELEVLEPVRERVTEIINTILADGVERAMNRHNG